MRRSLRRGQRAEDLLRRLGFSFLMTAFIVPTVTSLAIANPLPAWMVIKPGAVAYLDDEGSRFDPPGRRTVCRHLWSYLHRAETDGGGRCTVRRAFGLVRINDIVAHAARIRGGQFPIVAIMSPSEGWSGVVIGLALLPIVPKGTRLILRRGATFSRSSVVTFAKGVEPSDGFTIVESTTVEVLRQHAPDNEHYSIYVHILTGEHRNEKVWTSLFTVPDGAFWMQDPANIAP